MTNKKKGGINRPNKNNTNVSGLYSTDIWDALKDFQDTMKSRGVGSHIVDPYGGLQRARHPDDKAGSKNVYFEFFPTPVFGGYFGCWKRGIYQTWSFKSEKTFTHAEKVAFAKQIEHSKQKRQQEQKKRYAEAQQRAIRIWSGLYPASSSHDYAKAKRMGVTGLRQGNGNIVVPLYLNRKISTLQFISKTGGKKFLSGGRIKGACFIWGDIKKPFKTAYLCEGVSSGFSLYKLSDYQPVFCAMNASNLKAVALKVREAFPDVDVIVGADNDIREDKKAINTGVKYATEAAQAVNGKVSIPQLPNGEKCDWCDVYTLAIEKSEGVK